jgi:hypothetical protein
LEVGVSHCSLVSCRHHGAGGYAWQGIRTVWGNA